MFHTGLNRRTSIIKTLLIAGGATLGLLSGAARAQDKGLVGIAMPTKSSARWIADGENMVKAFQAKGYKTDLQYAEDDIPNQLAQIENLITRKVKVLVIASIDGSALAPVVQKAADRGIKVVAYDRLIKGTKNVDYYVTFDNFQVGVMQAQSLVDKLGLAQGKGPFNIELFGGSPDDNNATFFYDGAMSVLKPYLDSGKLVVRSKQFGIAKVGTLRWDAATAQARMDNLLSDNYSDCSRVDGVLSPYDALSRGIPASLASRSHEHDPRSLDFHPGADGNPPRPYHRNRALARRSLLLDVGAASRPGLFQQRSRRGDRDSFQHRRLRR